MSKAEKYLPYLLSVMLPGLNMLSNSDSGRELHWSAVIPHWCTASLYLFGLWKVIDLRLRKKKKIPRRIQLSTDQLIFIDMGLYIVLFFLIDYWLLPKAVGLSNVISVWALLPRFFISAVMFFTVQKVFHTLQEKEMLNTQNLSLQYESLRAQLETFKQQINPHFLFNSLNTLIDLIEDNPQLAVEFVRNFSNIYRFVLQSSRKDLILVEDELVFVEDYYRLLKIRFGKAIDLRLSLPDSLTQKLIPPLSLQLLIENAIKHNTTSVTSPLTITIKEYADGIEVSNPIRPKIYPETSAGLGLENLDYRFEFLLHQKISYGIQGDFFVVKLPLNHI